MKNVHSSPFNKAAPAAAAIPPITVTVPGTLSELRDFSYKNL